MGLIFSTPGMLWLLPLAALPIALHIHARTRERAIDFPGAFFLVNPALPFAERRRQLEDIALLAMRVVLLTAAILALAGPRAKGWASGASSDPQAGREAVCVVLDDSPSMSQWTQTREGDGFSAEVLRLGQVLASDPRRRVALETASGIGWPLQAGEAFVRQAGRRRWESVLSGDRTLALGRGLAALRDTGDDRKVVILHSDLRGNQAEGGGGSLVVRWQAALKAFQEPDAAALVAVVPERRPARQWRIEFVGTGDRAAAAERVPVAGQPFQARLRIRCLSGAGRRELRVETAPWRFDRQAAKEQVQAQAILERALILAEGQSVEIEVPLLSTEPCALWISAVLGEPDEWPYDDAAATVLLVRPKRAAVLWDLRRERPERDVALQSTVFALDPLSGMENGRVALGRPAEARVEDARPGVLAVILCGPDGPRWSQGLSERLRGAVESGATVLWIPDLTGDARGWVPSLPGRTVASDPLLPRALEGAEARTGPADAAWRIADARTAHPLLRPFAGGRNGDLPGVHFRRRLRLAIEPEPARLQAGVEEHVLARFDDGLPALVIQRIGAGWSCQMAFGLEPQGGLADSAAWPVLLSEFLELAADDGLGAASTVEVSPGASGARSWPIAPVAFARSIRLAGPWTPRPGELLAAPVHRWSLEIPANASEIQLPSLSDTGLYRFEVQGCEIQRFLDCRVAPEESLPEAMSDEIRDVVAQVARASGGATISNVRELDQAMANLQPGRPLAPFCWIAFALLMALELAVLVWRGRSG